MTKKKDDELTLDDISRARDLIKREYKEKVIYEDEFQKIWATCGMPTKIQLKKKGLSAIEEIVGKLNPRTKKIHPRQLTEIFGIPIITTEVLGANK